MSIPLVCGLAALTMAGIVLFGRRDDPDRPRRRHRHVPGLPDDGWDDPLQDWEWERIRWMEAYYSDTAHDPMTCKNAARRRK